MSANFFICAHFLELVEYYKYIYLLLNWFEILLLDVHKNKKITYRIAYFAAVGKYNLARKEFRAENYAQVATLYKLPVT